jgi:hypothetical protein
MSSGGGLLDLVARGKKDTFFTSNPKISFFHSVYSKQPAFTQEIRITHPRNNPEWGRWVDFEIEPIGDIIKKFVLLVDLPSWLPLSQANNNRTSITTDLDGVEYGYTQDVGATFIDKVQIFNDQILLHEFWGQFLAWRISQQPNSTVYGRLQGRHIPGPGAIARAATPGRLHLYLPVLGNQCSDDMGFPIIALHNQRFRIRVHIKKLEDIIEASDGRLFPKPWGQTFQQQIDKNSPPIQFQTLQRAEILGPILSLETTQIYIPRDSQEYLRKTVISLPFQQVQQSIFTIEDSKWQPIVNTGTTVSIALPLDFIGPTSRITVGIQTEAAQFAGQYYDLNPPPGRTKTFIQGLRLNMGTIDRINMWSDIVLRDVANYYKNYREGRNPNDGVNNVYTLTFGPKEKEQYRPLGTFNLSRTLQATLYVDLAAIAIDPRLKSRKSFVIVYGESWNIFEIKDGKGKVMFAD